MKTKSSLIIPALIIVVAVSRMCAESAVPFVNDTGRPRKDLSLIEQRNKPRITAAKTQYVGEHLSWGVPLLPESLHLSAFSIDISEAKLRANRQVLKITIAAGQKPVTCELRSPCRIVLKPESPDKRMNFDLGVGFSGSLVFSGGVTVEVFVQEQLVLDLTGYEVALDVDLF
jgi:hypothetical protein